METLTSSLQEENVVVNDDGDQRQHCGSVVTASSSMAGVRGGASSTDGTGRGGGGRRRMDNASRGDNFRTYMQNKIEKQRLELGAITTTSSSSLFFRGVVCLINGYTNPDREDLTRRIQKYGGAVELYETSLVTHIIASQLSVAKMNGYQKKRKKPIPVVVPQYILACIEQGKLLPPNQFLLPGFASSTAKITTLANFQQHKISSTTTDSPNDTNTTTTTPTTITTATTTTINSTTNNLFGVVRTVSTDPNFLEDYFRNSRLSFIGSFKQRTTTTHHHYPNSSPSAAAAAVGLSSANSNSRSLSTPPQQTTVQLLPLIFHIDMDSFFASVVLRRYPQYRDKPVVICHSSSSSSSSKTTNTINQKQSTKFSTSECATCNYEARKYGIEKGMFLGEAKKLCPNVIVLPYDFDGYEEVSSKASDIVHYFADRYNGRVEQVSCDEFYAEMFFPTCSTCTDNDESGTAVSINGDSCYNTGSITLLPTAKRSRRGYAYDLAETTAENIRAEIYAETNCTATVGVARNKFLAKVATNQVKPNKCLIVPKDEERSILKELALKDLPGIGPKSERLLQDHDLISVTDVWDLGERPKAEKVLTNILGIKSGMKIVEFCYGEDSRKLEPASRKSIGAECNYGVRFDGPYGVDHMIRGLAKELERRMEEAAVKGKHITLKVKKRKEGEGEAFKYLGHGRCHNLSKSCDITGSVAIRDCDTITRYGILLLKELMVDKADIRGMGIVLSKLVEDDTTCESSAPSIMQAWLQNKSTVEKDNIIVEVLSEDDLQNVEQQLSDGEKSVSFKGAYMKSKYASRTPMEENFFMDDIEIPPMSQIDRNEIEAMPRPLRDRILKKLSDYEKNKACSSTMHSNSRRQQVSSPLTKKENKKRKAAGSSLQLSRVGKRQLNLKSMLVLASVKSGKEPMKIDGEPVSLTQLQALPLAVQLEVANQDEMSLTSTYSYCIDSPQQFKNRVKALHTREESLDYPAFSLRNLTPPKKISNNNESQDTFKSIHPAPVEKVDETNYLKDDAIFLRTWLDSNLPNSIDGSPLTPLMKLTDFLCLCVDEKRLEHAIVFLRMVKHRRDEWGGESCYYQSLLDNVKKHVKSKHCVNLDEKWHCL